ncbi:ATP-binding cassette domain-containing protein [Streptococcus ovis]|uniref:ATP-binding cassette domain-containing protein n=1 Tax=Streptococcus ovis TaxID=82806 RepID=UPI000370ACC6|nr:ATP-binding cassette domain-containing protein [Streptococcus ovis]
MLKFEHLTITHQKDLQELIHDLNLVINPGDKVAIIGEEGTGKSTLLKSIVLPEEIAQYVSIEGQIINQFHQTAYLPQRLTAAQLAQTVQDFLYSDIDYTLFDFNLFYKMAEQFQLDVDGFQERKQTLASLSGGERLKIQLLNILAEDPDLILLDEPSSDLDLETVKWLEQFIRQTEKTVLFISHDEALLTHAATAILHLELLKKRKEPRASYFHGNYENYKVERREQFERQLQVAKKEREEHGKKVQENQRIQQRVQHALRTTKNDVIGRLLAKKMRALQSQERRYGKEAEHFTEIPQDMDAIHLFFNQIEPLPPQKRVLTWEKKELPTGQKIDLDIRGQDKIVITGRNGIGKTRLLKDINAALSQSLGLSIGYMPQHYEELLIGYPSALDFVAEHTNEQTARTFLASLRFTRDEMTHALSDLSGGQKAKLFLAKMVVSGNNVLLLDEPTRHFSPTSQPLVRQLFQDYPGCIISVSHDQLFIEEVAHKRYVLTVNHLHLAE